MSKQYKLKYNFKDGQSWGAETQDVKLDAEQIAFMLNHFQSSENMEVQSQATNETRKVSDIQSIELIF
ncbi:hypothetical protein [Priestia flexa]|uniref:hypothetical protein n=1 Tax=Priestia flexa TaxID=86664 RepID=UPI001CFD5DF7|nr:hypothetical protein [Priestia flexa]